MKTILIIEDERDLIFVCRTKLLKRGHNVLEARTSEDALKILEGTTPDLILLDIILPGKSGLEFLKTIRADERWKSTPVVMLTNLDNKQKQSLELGALDYIIKSNTSVDDLVIRVEEILKTT